MHRMTYVLVLLEFLLFFGTLSHYFYGFAIDLVLGGVYSYVFSTFFDDLVHHIKFYGLARIGRFCGVEKPIFVIIHKHY